jgi:hypothetical protein
MIFSFVRKIRFPSPILKAYSVAIFSPLIYCLFDLDLESCILVQNLDTNVRACQRAITARTRIRAIHMISPAGIMEFVQ